MPRKYSMERRTAAVDETRLRIVDATVALHAEKGVVATSMQDVAARAGVALGTVYRHFPTLNELVPACGGRIMELTPPPSPDVFAGLTDGAERVRALIAALYEHYDAARRPYFVGISEADRVPALRAFVDEGNTYIRSLVTQAVAPATPSEQGLGVAIAMADFRTWLAFTDAGFDTQAAARTATQIVTSHLPREGSAE